MLSAPACRVSSVRRAQIGNNGQVRIGPLYPASLYVLRVPDHLLRKEVVWVPSHCLLVSAPFTLPAEEKKTSSFVAPTFFFLLIGVSQSCHSKAGFQRLRRIHGDVEGKHDCAAPCFPVNL